MMARIADVLIAVLSALVIVVNLIAMVCLLKSFRRLRQRLYVFIISLTAVEVIVGSAYMVDVVLKFATGAQWNVEGQDVFEGLKSSSVVLSALNTVVVTYALHKRTTSMGRHRGDTAAMSGEGTGILHLPAFDTMMRVLSMGPNASQNNSPRKPGSRRDLSRAKSGLAATDSVDDKSLDLSIQQSETSSLKQSPYSSANKSKDTTYIKSNSGSAQNLKRTSANQKYGKTAQMPRLKSFLVPRQSWTNGSHHRTSSGISTQSYVGRHGNSVVSVRSATILLFVIWLTFLVMWIAPVMVRRVPTEGRRQSAWFDPFLCNYECDMLLTSSVLTGVSQVNVSSIGALDVRSENILETNRRVRNHQNGRSLSANTSWYGNVTDLPGEKVTSTALPPSNNASTTVENESSPHGGDSHEEFANRNISEHEKLCSEKCSSFFFPLSRLLVVVNASVITLAWFFMLASSMHLLRLRKHSSNVFVRCSALWRFIFAVSLFYFVTLAPYVVLCVIDLLKGFEQWNEPVLPTSLLSDNRLSNSTTSRQDSLEAPSPSFDTLPQPWRHLTMAETFYMDAASGLLLVHCAVLPALYLVRLLGFRRLLAGV